MREGMVLILGAGLGLLGPVSSAEAQVSIQPPPGVVDVAPAGNTATDADTLPAGLTIAKDDGRTEVVAGRPVTYTITVTNSGPGDVFGATVTDVFPPELEGVIWTCTESGGGSCGPPPEPGAVDETEPNDSFVKPQKLAAESWSLAFDANIGDASTNTSTTIPHLTVHGTGDGTPDFFSFVVGNAGDRGIFDIDFGTDGGLDSYLRLFDHKGSLLAANDDNSTSFGQGGSSSGLDSYLEYVFPTPGVYVIEVASCCISAPPPGTEYQLQVSIEDTPAANTDIAALVDLPVGGTLTFIATGTLSLEATGELVNTATVAAPPGIPDPVPTDNTATDVDTLVAPFSVVKEVSGNFGPGGSVFYTLTVVNNTSVGQPDNPGPEFLDYLPPEVTLMGASASSGVLTADVTRNTLSWNGSIPAFGTVTISLEAVIHAGTEGLTVFNQAELHFSLAGDATNDAVAFSQDPVAGGPTAFVVPVGADIPALGGWGLLVLSMLLVLVPLAKLRH